MVQVFSHQAGGFIPQCSVTVVEMDVAALWWLFNQFGNKKLALFKMKELRFFNESSLLFLFKLSQRCEVWFWCGVYSSVASCHSWRRFGALITLPYANPSWPTGLLTITAVLTLNQTLQLSHSSRPIICSLGSCRHTSVSQLPNWMMWGFVVCKEAGCCCNHVFFQPDKKGSIS